MINLDDKYKLDSYIYKIDWIDGSWSYSKLCSYSCPRYFKYNYIDKFTGLNKFKNSVPLVKGRFIHSAIEKWINKYHKNKQIQLYNPFECNDDELNIDVLDVTDWNHKLDHFYYSAIWDFLTNVFDKADFLETEYEIRYKGVFKGYIDLICISGDTLYIIDWKTGKVRDYEFKQVTLYCYAILELLNTYDIKKIDLRYVFVEEPDTDQGMKCSVEEFLDSNLHILVDFRNILENISKEQIHTKGIYVPESMGWTRCSSEMNSSQCRYCSMKEYCLSDSLKDLNFVNI